MVVLELEYDETYRFILDSESFQKMIFEVGIIDDQIFSLFMQLKDDSLVQHIPLFCLQQTIGKLKN